MCFIAQNLAKVPSFTTKLAALCSAGLSTACGAKLRQSNFWGPDPIAY